MLFIAGAVLVVITLAGCAGNGNGKLDRGEVWSAIGAVVVAGAIVSFEGGSPSAGDVVPVDRTQICPTPDPNTCIWK